MSALLHKDCAALHIDAAPAGGHVEGMTHTMQAVMLTKKGGPKVLQTVELPLPTPGPG